LSGDDVCQLYVRDELSTVSRPVSELKGFSRIHLEPGETKEVSIVLPPETFMMIDKRMNKITEPGYFRIMVGSSCMDIRLRGILRIVE